MTIIEHVRGLVGALEKGRTLEFENLRVCKIDDRFVIKVGMHHLKDYSEARRAIVEAINLAA